MFERFTKRARRVIVLSQDEARELQHHYIGSEHLLLGLLGEPDGLAAQALAQFGMSLASVREEVVARVGAGSEPVKGRIPFTPRAKKILELSLREALALHHNYIGTEHIVLGLIREGDGAGAQILKSHAGELVAVRQAVLDLLPAARTTPGHRWLHRRAADFPEPGEPGEEGEPEQPTTPAAEAGLAGAARLAGDGPMGSHHLLLATLADPDAAAARVLTGLGLDLEQARQALRNADVTDTSDELPAERGRRQMVLRVTDNRVILETTDPEIVRVAHGTLQMLGDRAGEPGSIRGDLPDAASLATVWQALRDSLEEILRRARAALQTQADQEKKGLTGSD